MSTSDAPGLSPSVAYYEHLESALRRADATFSKTFRDDKVTRFSVHSFPDLDVFSEELRDEGFTASYSAGSGWTFKEAHRG